MGWRRGLAVICASSLNLGVCSTDTSPEVSVSSDVPTENTIHTVGSMIIRSTETLEANDTIPRSTTTTIGPVVINSITKNEITTTTQTSDTLPSTYYVTSSNPLTEEQEAQNQVLIESTIKDAAERLHASIPEPIHEDKAQVTAASDFIMAAPAYAGCGAIVTIRMMDVVNNGVASPSDRRELGIVFVGDLNKLMDGNSYTPKNFEKTYNQLDHEEPGYLQGDMYEFNPSNSDSVTVALQNMASLIQTICSNLDTPGGD